MSLNQSDYADQLRRTKFRKPSAASESFITALAVLFFISLALLFQFLDRKKSGVNDNVKTEHHSANTEHSKGISFDPGYSFPDLSTDRIAGNVNTGTLASEHIGTSIHQNGIHPPFPLLDIKPQQYVVDAGAGLAFNSTHNSRITIPTYAFLDKGGNIVTGKVEVSYREFYNYIDIFRSGIPMTYASGADKQQLESAGMFEFTASKDNEPVYPNPESRISVMMASMNNKPGYNIYYFDKKENQWIEKGPSEARVTQSCVNGFNLTKEEYIEKKFFYYKPEYTIKISGHWEQGKIKKSLFSTKQTPDHFNLHFLYTKNTIPELNTIRSITWRYTGPDSKSLYDKVFNSRNGKGIWKDASMVHIDEDDTWLLTLSNDTFTTGFKVIPLLSNDKSVIKYKELITAYKQEQEERIAAQKAEFDKFQADTIAYFASNPRFVKRDVPNQFNIVRQFQLDGFGVWNCDRPITISNAVTLALSFKDENDRKIYPINVYLVDKSLNTVFRFDGYRMDNFKFNPLSQNLVWAVFPGDVIAVIRPDEFKEKYSKARFNCTIKVNLNKSAVLNEDELKEQLAFKRS